MSKYVNTIVLTARFGADIVDFFKDFGITEYDVGYFTHSEVMYLLKFSSVENMRKKLRDIKRQEDLSMVSSEFVQKYLEVKERLKRKEITAESYKALIIALCVEYQVDPAVLAEYNMDLEPRKVELDRYSQD